MGIPLDRVGRPQTQPGQPRRPKQREPHRTSWPHRPPCPRTGFPDRGTRMRACRRTTPRSRTGCPDRAGIRHRPSQQRQRPLRAWHSTRQGRWPRSLRGRRPSLQRPPPPRLRSARAGDLLRLVTPFPTGGRSGRPDQQRTARPAHPTKLEGALDDGPAPYTPPWSHENSTRRSRTS